MENLEQGKEIISLGKLLVKELDLEDSTDTLSRWMAHYVAEKIKQVESFPPGKEKEELEAKCFEIVLKIWAQRWMLPSGKRPFENFEPLLKVLKKLDPDSPTTFFPIPEEDVMDEQITGTKREKLKSYLDIALQLDKTFKIWMSEIVHQAATIAREEKANAFLEQASNFEDNIDVKVIRSILAIGKTLKPKDSEDDYEKQRLVEKIESRIKTLTAYASLNESVLNSLNNSLLLLQE